MTEINLRCNITSCRKSVAKEKKAVVTNCSHIFCLDCANSQSSLTHYESHPICPACASALTEPDDVVCTSLNPTADYKASVLSGLAPSVIIQIANQALGFWAYQQSMEANYQAMLLKKSQEKTELALQDKYRLESQAKKEIKSLVQRLKSTESALNIEKRRIAMRALTSDRDDGVELEKFRFNSGRPRNASNFKKNRTSDAHLEITTPISSSRGLSRAFPRDNFIRGGLPPGHETYKMPERVPAGPTTVNSHSCLEISNADQFPKLRDLGSTYKSHPQPTYRDKLKKSRRQFSDTSLRASRAGDQAIQTHYLHQTRKDRHSLGSPFVPLRP